MNRQRPNTRSSTPCPRCGKLISINSDQCIYCGLGKPGNYLRIPVVNDLIADRISFVQPITIVCVLLYVLAIVLDLSGTQIFGGGIFDMLSPSNRSLYQLGMGGLLPWQAGRWWTLITANYLHASLLHIGFNLLWLRQIGPWVVELYGASRFWIIYTIAGLTGSILSTIAGTYFFVGASGAIFGLFGALLFYGRHRGGTFGSNLFRQMLIWVVIAFAFGFLGRGIDNWGHFGGLIGGIAAAWLLGYQERRRQSLSNHLLAAGLILFVVICFSFMLINFFS